MTAVDRAGNSPLHVAAQQGNLTLVNALLARKMDPDIRTPTANRRLRADGGAARRAAAGWRAGGARGGGGGARGASAGAQTPLMLAAKADHEDVMRALVAAGADPTTARGRRQQPAHGCGRRRAAQDLQVRL